MSDTDPAPEWFIRRAVLRALQGQPALLPLDPEPDSNIVSIAAARTRRATAQMLRARAPRERPL
jgi:hypothetical protein